MKGHKDERTPSELPGIQSRAKLEARLRIETFTFLGNGQGNDIRKHYSGVKQSRRKTISPCCGSVRNLRSHISKSAGRFSH